MSAPHENAPHGGTWIQTDAGFIEISVFETGVPPHFRLYFFDAAKRPVAPLPEMVATLETLRLEEGGAKQVFSFTDEGSYLQSTSDIPEPHEFEVVLKLTQQGNEQVFKTTFTEEAHGHGHGHDHNHGPDGHSHDHGPGLLGWFRGTFAHSHAAADKIDDTMESSVMKIIHPQPMNHLWWVAAAAIIGFVGNEAVAVFRIKTGNAIGSAALVADGMHARVDGFTSLAVLIGVIGTWMGYPIVDPIVGVLITIAILFIVKDAAISVLNRMIERIEPEILAEVEHAPTHVPGVQSVHQARARWVGHRVFVDLHITVDPDMSVKDSHAIVDAVQQTLKEHVPSFGEATIHICPAAPSLELKMAM